MKKWFVVCLCFDRAQCEADTAEIAKRNNATEYVIEPVRAGTPFPSWLNRNQPFVIAYRGSILVKQET